MESITAQNILDRNYTLGQVLQLLPSNVGELFEDVGYDLNDLTDDYIEEPGDLNELMLMHVRDCLDNNHNRIGDFVKWYRVIMAVCSIIGFQEFEQLPSWQEFKSEYPQVGKMLIVWGWS